VDNMKQNQIKDSNIKLLGTYNYEQMFNVYKDDNDFYYYNLLKNLTFPEEIESRFLRVALARPGELLPQLSFRLYGVVNLWWTIAGLNNILNPLEPLDPEIPLTVLTNEGIRVVLAQIKE